MFNFKHLEYNAESFFRMPVGPNGYEAKEPFALRTTTCRHFRRFGIRDGSIIVFDMGLPFEEGKLSCFIDASKENAPKFRLSTTNLEGYDYMGSLISCINYYN